jgi:dTDP-4-amino-4,6-dideoxygalactose transaminase/nucleoside-diphosphate-sugar epimerase
MTLQPGSDGAPPAVVIGGAGFVGTSLCARLLRAGWAVTGIDRAPRPTQLPPAVSWITADLLTDEVQLPSGEVFVTCGVSETTVRRPWTLVLDNAFSMARLAPALAGRSVRLLSSIEVYGSAPGPLRESTTPQLPVTEPDLRTWCSEAAMLARRPCPAWQVADHCEQLTAYDPTGRWVYGLAKLAQELLLRQAVDEDRLIVLRSANVMATTQHRLVTKLIRSALVGRSVQLPADTTRTFLTLEQLLDALCAPLAAGTYTVGAYPMTLTNLADQVARAVGRPLHIDITASRENDSVGTVDASAISSLCPSLGQPWPTALRRLIADVREAPPPLFSPPLDVVLPPRPERAVLVAHRQQECLWTGRVKYGQRWTLELEDQLRSALAVPDRYRVIATTSGTAALRLAVSSVVGQVLPGDVAVLPSFTFPATAEALVQLGFTLRFCDVDPDTWTCGWDQVAPILESDRRVRVVMPVDAFGNPCGYAELVAGCHAHGVAVVADSAPSLGSRYRACPVGSQADAHAFSMSFAKTVVAGGTGGVAVLPAAADPAGELWLRSSLMQETNAVYALDQLASLEELVTRRSAVAAVYGEVSRRHPFLGRQRVMPGDRHSWVHYVFCIPQALSRDVVATGLARLGVSTKPYYAPLLHRLSWPATSEPARLPASEKLCDEVLALPMSSEMTVPQAEKVALALDEVLMGASEVIDRNSDAGHRILVH